ncbi:type IV secretory system conjugative DNA transfer family protein [Streptomyces sp. NRRL S-15]|uniref:type IV secretory system conjugative DNA transfer family protein n=1 Tax=Streptomyces sp. NRRL S-15 TaxID=1463886 RepID=UPI0004C78552|nr:type IV secretory system conjugative DNA transfer family protein [Streptomyces sp. NRRL S-15]
MARQAPPGPGHGGERQGGIPDGLLIGLLVFLFGLMVLAWTATGLAGLLAHGGWPDGVTFMRTPLALRALAVEPADLPAAWPDTPPGALSGYGLFWGLLIGEVMVLLVLAVFAVGVVTRWRLVRKQRNAAPAPYETEQDREHIRTAAEAPMREATPAEAPPSPTPAPAETARTTPAPIEATPAPASTAPYARATTSTAPLAAYTQESSPLLPTPRTPHVLYGASATRRPAVVQAIREAEGPALVVASDPTVWAETKDARSKLGPVLVYDPGHLCDTPARLHWSPVAGCEDPAIAASRAAALLTPVRPPARIDAAVADTAQTLLQCWLHAAAVDGRPLRQVHRWASGAGSHEPVRLLRTHPKAASGHAGLLESALTAYPERRDMAQELTVRAFSALSSVHIREACTPNRADALALDSFAREGGTLYVVGEPIEDPRHHPGAMPLLTALASHVVEHGRRMAVRSTDGRLDPPMTLVLDDVAAVAPLPELPRLLSAGQGQGMATLALLRSEEQARARWRERLPTP